MNGNYQKFISKEDINALPLFEFTGQLEVIETHEGALHAVRKLSQESILGFDTETKPNFVKGQSNQIALLQLATEDCAYLFRMKKIPPCQELGELMANPRIVKAGVGILDDLKGLQKIIPGTFQGFTDLSKEAERRGFTSLGLRALTAIFLEQRLSKAAKITNWERSQLTEAQLKYAASDALVGLRIYKKMFP